MNRTAQDLVGRMTDAELRDLRKTLCEEEQRREEAACRRKDECPDCYGTGYGGSDMDHIPCDRCKTTGRYVAPNNAVTGSEDRR